jgi:nucleoside phosphorylase
VAKHRHFDIGIVVPLREEFRYLLEVSPQLESFSHEGTYFYRLDFGATSAICCVVDQMGPLPALQAAIRLLGFAEVKLLVVLGVAGALDDDVALGDVVVAREINEFQANSKAESVEAGYEVRYSGRHWTLDFQIREALSNFEFSAQDCFGGWRAATSEHYREMNVPGDIRGGRPSFHIGPIASGNVVAASSAFVEEIKKIDRKFIAIDMEAAGVASAADDRIHSLPCLVIRGISDRADENKKGLDSEGKKGWRRYAVRNAAALLAGLLKWGGFLNAIGVGAKPSGTEDFAKQLASQMKSHVGGAWLVGVAFGIYYHGPAVINGEAVPMDLNRLGSLDPNLHSLLAAAEKARENLLIDGRLPQAAKCFAELIEGYRAQLGSPKALSLLQGFDQVVVAVLCPEDDNQEVESVLLQAERLEEESGTDAVIDFLREFANSDPRIRERYADALAASKKWSELAQLVESIEPTGLSRLELEHGFSASAEMGLTDRAKALMRQHRSSYDDNAAAIFRREVTRRYPSVSYDEPGEAR